ncbi:hypothetical protein LRAMOSA10333 [Lichtheimia ramosa]|uniref:REJ domain-containing protein n=1 Tax=Lichtheimia ramosa TaxID=688394 RepID=A0A077WPE4_9FUNG|nr:hypothetical protein LRAMOSA10333 [Lichtheimia ramosa]
MHWFTLFYPLVLVVAVLAQEQHEESTPTPSTTQGPSPSMTSTTTSSSANSTITPTTDDNNNNSTSSSLNGSTTTTMSFLTHFSAPAHRPSSSSFSSFHPTQSAPYPDDTVGKYGPLHVSTAVVSTPWMFVISITISTVVLLLLSSL